MRRTLVVLVAVATLVSLPSAQATTASHTDPTGDVTGAGDARADIVTVDAAYAGGTITLGLAVAKPEAPSSRNWVDGDTGIFWTIFHPSGAEFEANFSAFDDGPSGSLFDENEVVVCDDQVSATFGTDGRYSVSFPSSCLGDPASISVTAEIGYDDIAAGKGPSEDVAPDNEEECCSVAP